MTKEELLQKEKELCEIVNKENEKIESNFKRVIENAAGFEITFDMIKHYWSKEVSLRIGIIYEDNRKVDMNVYFEEKREWRSDELRPDSGLMNVNYGTYGSHTKLDKNGKLKLLDILIGEIWKLEDGLTDLYNSIDWTNEEKLNEVEIQLHKIEQEEKDRANEEKRKQEQKVIDDKLASLKVGTVIYTYYEGCNIEIEKITKDYIYLNLPYSFNSWKGKNAKKRFEKEYFVKQLIKRDQSNK